VDSGRGPLSSRWIDPLRWQGSYHLPALARATTETSEVASMAHRATDVDPLRSSLREPARVALPLTPLRQPPSTERAAPIGPPSDSPVPSEEPRGTARPGSSESARRPLVGVPPAQFSGASPIVSACPQRAASARPSPRSLRSTTPSSPRLLPAGPIEDSPAAAALERGGPVAPPPRDVSDRPMQFPCQR
jgi:hypothetical protein